MLAYKRPDLAYPAQNITAEMCKLSLEVEPFEHFRLVRVLETKDGGILFRPGIVDDMKRLIFSAKYKHRGVMVRGPPGVGKSHSLVNLVLSLRAAGHIVTFIPVCEPWRDYMYLIDAVCRGLGTTASKLGITPASFDGNTFNRDFAETVVESLKLLNRNKPEAENVRWILVFDQLNRLFGRKENENLKDVGVLPLPFRLMKTLT